MQKAAEKIWEEALDILRQMLNAETYKLWFSRIRAKAINGTTIHLEVIDEFNGVWLKENYLGLICDVLARVSGQLWKVEFEVAKTVAKAPEPAPMPLPAPPPPAKPVHQNGSSRASAQSADSVFNPANTFESFVVGNSNTFAHGAAMAVAQSPGRSYNPLFLYGGVGLGKTHLLHAIGQHVQSHKKAAKVAYVSSERFTNEFIDAIQNNQLAKFRRRYRQTDVLLIDDIQFLAGKERIQEEFFHTFNALHEARKQIVLTCDRTAAEIQNLEQRLVSRFEWGLVTDLQPPDVETRVAILRKKERTLNIRLNDDIINFIAERVRTNIRRLEGAMIRVASYASLTGREVSVDMVEELLREVLHEEGRHSINIEVIQRRVAEHFDIRHADMTSKRRPEHIAFPRQIAMFLSRKLTESSLSTIGDAFGGRDHGTVLHACRLVKDRMEVDANVRHVVTYLEKQLLR
ncbi:chromosomal replication initiator protein DnaA [bacterium]|nr:chromosomal replication initiator protein DnaA [bacterium]